MSSDLYTTYFITSEKLTASSMPGKDPTISCNIALPAVKKSSPPTSSGNSVMPPEGSISMANKFSNPLTFVGFFVNF